jgi:hypothetical protein
MNIQEEDNWREYWRQNSPEYQRNKRQQKSQRILFIVVSGIIVFVILTKPKFNEETFSAAYDHIVDYSNSGGNISYKDELFLEKMQTIQNLYDKDTLDIDLINKHILSLSEIPVTDLFRDLHKEAQDELLKINPYVNKNATTDEHKFRFYTYYDIYFNKFETVLKENNKKYERKDDRITYYIEYR